MNKPLIIIVIVVMIIIFIYFTNDNVQETVNDTVDTLSEGVKEIMGIKPKYANTSSPYDDIIEKYADMYSVDPLLIRAVIQQESTWRKDVIGYDGKSIGLMQITKPLAHDFFYSIGMVYASYNPSAPDVKFSDFVEPDINIRIGVWKLSNDLKYYKGDLNKTLDAYNEGRGNVNAGIDIDYSDKVLAFYSAYKGEKV